MSTKHYSQGCMDKSGIIIDQQQLYITCYRALVYTMLMDRAICNFHYISIAK